MRFKKVSINSFILMTAFLISVLFIVIFKISHHNSGIRWYEDYPIIYSYSLMNIVMIFMVFITYSLLLILSLKKYNSFRMIFIISLLWLFYYSILQYSYYPNFYGDFHLSLSNLIVHNRNVNGEPFAEYFEAFPAFYLLGSILILILNVSSTLTHIILTLILQGVFLIALLNLYKSLQEKWFDSKCAVITPLLYMLIAFFHIKHPCPQLTGLIILVMALSIMYSMLNKGRVRLSCSITYAILALSLTFLHPISMYFLITLTFGLLVYAKLIEKHGSSYFFLIPFISLTIWILYHATVVGNSITDVIETFISYIFGKKIHTPVMVLEKQVYQIPIEYSVLDDLVIIYRYTMYCLVFFSALIALSQLKVFKKHFLYKLLIPMTTTIIGYLPLIIYPADYAKRVFIVELLYISFLSVIGLRIISANKLIRQFIKKKHNIINIFSLTLILTIALFLTFINSFYNVTPSSYYTCEDRAAISFIGSFGNTTPIYAHTRLKELLNGLATNSHSNIKVIGYTPKFWSNPQDLLFMKNKFLLIGLKSESILLGTQINSCYINIYYRSNSYALLGVH